MSSVSNRPRESDVSFPAGVAAIYSAETEITSPESRSGDRPHTWKTDLSFEPIADFDVWEGDIHKSRSGGEQPTYYIKGLGGELIRHGGKLFFRTSLKRVIDPTNALTMARIGCPDLKFYRGKIHRDQVKPDELVHQAVDHPREPIQTPDPQIDPLGPFGGVSLGEIRILEMTQPSKEDLDGHSIKTARQIRFDFGRSNG